MRPALLALGVGLALADSSVVTLALPEILGEFDVAITTVAWVLTSFNLVLAVVAVPAAYVSRRRPREAFVVGVVVFAVASLACGLAPSFEVLVGARCVQALGAALLVTAALDLLSQAEGSDEAALRTWVAAGVLGAALGPGRRRNPHAAARLGVDLPRAGAARARVVARGARSGRSAGAGSRRETVDHRERRAAPRRGRPRRRALPRRAPPGRRVGDVTGRGRRRRDGHAAHRDRRRSPPTPVARRRAGHRVRRDPARRRPGCACAHAARRVGLDDPTADPRRRGPRAHGRRAHGARAPRPGRSGRARWLDDRRAPRGRRPRARPARPGAHERARGESRRGDPRGRGRRARQRHPAARQARGGAGRPRRGRPRRGARRAPRRRARVRRTARRRRVARAHDGLQEQLDRAVTSAFSGPFLLAAALTLCALVPVALLRRRPA